MGILGGISGKEVIRKLNRIGYEVVRHEGSHVTLRKQPHSIYPLLVTVPRHRELKIGTLKDIIKNAGLTVEEFIEL